MIALLALQLAVLTTPEPIEQMLAFDGLIHQGVFETTIAPGCVKYPDCSDMQRRAFDTLHSQWRFLDSEQRESQLKAIEKYTEDGYRNWYYVLYPPKRYWAPQTPRSRVTCSTHVSKSGQHATTNCW